MDGRAIGALTMSESVWSAVDDYFEAALVGPQASLARALAASDAASLPHIHVSPAQGKMIHLLARIQGAKRILEIGTLGGYSTIWLASALPPDGRLISLELDASHASVARDNLNQAGFAAIAEVRVGPASESLAALVEEGVAPFDLIFIDADKSAYAGYLESAIRLARSGSVIIADNVVRGGRVIQAESLDDAVRGVRAFTERLSGDSRLTATAVQTVGVKGYDGFVLAVVN